MRRMLVVLVLAAALLIACGERPAKDIGLQPSDVRGLKQCPNSGNVDHLLHAEGQQLDVLSTDYLRADEQAWTEARATGATDSWAAIYSPTTRDWRSCAYSFSSGYATGADSVVIKFHTADDARIAWSSGLLTGGMSPTDTYRLYQPVAGDATGLGPDSVVYTGKNGLGVAYWQKGSTLCLLEVGDKLTAETLARKIDARM